MLKLPILDEAELQTQIRRLSISLEAQVVNASNPGDPSPAETIFKGYVEDVEDPFIVVDEEENDSSDEAAQNVYAVWKLSMLLSRPRMRLQSPSIVLSGSASLKPPVAAELSSRSTAGTGYLESGQPSSFNLLESFSGDSALGGVQPRLSALRVSRVAPITTQQDLVARLNGTSQVKIPIYPALHTRIRFARPNTVPSTSALIAMLEVDLTAYVECETILDQIDLVTDDAVVTSLNDETQLKLPLPCVSHDHITFLYQIEPLDESGVGRSNRASGALDISVGATVQVTPGVCAPRLSMAWTAALDFASANPNFNNVPEPSPGSGSILRSHKPSQLSIGGISSVTPLKSPSLTRPDSLPALEASTTSTETPVPELGITMSFTGPSTPVRAGDVFSWTVYVVNRSSSEKTTRPPRKLALVAVPRRKRGDSRPPRPPSTATRRRGEKELADAVMDLNVLHALQKNSATEGMEVVCLSADTRVGPLTPGACHVAELQFLALKEGIVGIEAIRVIDLSSQEHVDIRDLPTMIVEPAAA